MLARPPAVLVVRAQLTEALEARVVLVAMDIAPAGDIVAALVEATVKDAGRGNHSEDIWKEPRCRLLCRP